MNKEDQLYRHINWILGGCIITSIIAGVIFSVLVAWWLGLVIGLLLLYVSTRIVQLISRHKLEELRRHMNQEYIQNVLQAQDARKWLEET
jgi:asparagine N-glycosylation enzyme membrane subunit Stt3